jgi:hypothetical protein
MLVERTVAEDLVAELDALKREVRQLKDREEIRDLVSRYAWTADLEQYDDWLETLTEDCVWTMSGMAMPGTPQGDGGVVRGRSGCYEAVSSAIHGEIVNREQHHMTNLLIEIDGDEASAIGQLLLTIKFPGGFGIATCRLTRMHFRREHGRWLICELVFREIGEQRGKDMILETGLVPPR